MYQNSPLLCKDYFPCVKKKTHLTGAGARLISFQRPSYEMSFSFSSLTLDHRPMNTSYISCSSDNTAWVNDGVVFTCSSVSSPSPATYVIYHNGRIIKKNKSGYHKICNVKLRHAGTYTCEPRNTFGIGERRSVSFTVYGEFKYN